MSELSESRRQVIVYLFLVLAFSSVFYCLLLNAHKLNAGNGLYVTGLMWCPALAGAATLKLNGRSLRDLGWRWPQSKYAFAGWLIPLLYAAVTYLVVWTCGLGGFPNQQFMQHIAVRMGLHASPVISTILYVLLSSSFGLIGNLATALGEEIGWRGFLVPELFKTMNFTRTAILSGFVWALWHYPLIIWGEYNAGTPIWYGLTCFTISLVAISIVFVWLRLKSGSLWVAAVLHASHNLFIQDILSPLTSNTGRTSWLIDEFGAILPIVTIAFAVYFWRKRGELT
jgi:uncharacterized protein